MNETIEEGTATSSESPMLTPHENNDTLDEEDSGYDSPPPTGTCDPKFWSCPGAAGFKVRGTRYLKDHVKASLSFAFRVLSSSRS